MDKTIGFIGIGNMGSAIIQGLTQSNTISNNRIYAYDFSPQILKEKSQKLDFNPSKSNKEVIEKTDIVFFVVKPQGICAILEDIQNYARSEQIFISMAAGISINLIKSFFNFDAKIIRIMPNTPALIGEGMTGMSSLPPITNDDINIGKK